jgi:hypothetical protein
MHECQVFLPAFEIKNKKTNEITTRKIEEKKRITTNVPPSH